MVEKQRAGMTETLRRPVLLWYWGHRGGGSHFTLELARMLTANLGAENVWIATSSENEELPMLRELGAPLLLSRRAWASGLSVAARLRRTIELLCFRRSLAGVRFSAAVITMNFPLAWPLITRVRLSADRTIYVAHDAAPHPGDFQRLWQVVSQFMLIRTADHVVALSPYVADKLRLRFKCLSRRPNRLQTIPVDTVYSNATTHFGVEPKPAATRFLFIGRLIAYKGLALLQDAVRNLENRDDWSLTIAGAGPLESFVVRAFGGNPKCRLELGWLDPGRFTELIQRHDVLVLPYVEASQSGIISEALKYGRPAIVTPVGALPFQIGFGDFGIVAEAITPAAFASAMTRVLDDRSLLENLAQASAEHMRRPRQQAAWLSLLSSNHQCNS
jgi:glycosyltransferase involved in cell wall biosynthesis